MLRYSISGGRIPRWLMVGKEDASHVGKGAIIELQCSCFFPLGKVAPPCIALILLVLHSIFPDPSIEFSDNHWDPSTPSGKKTFTRIVQYLHHCAKWVHRSIQVLAMLCWPFQIFRHRFNWAPLSEEKLVHYVLKVEQGWTLYNICATLVEQDWTMYLTYGGASWSLWTHQKWSRGVLEVP